MTERKTDRRNKITQMLIKDAMLEILKTTPYEKISISAVCKQAELTRATFYLHYDHLDQVVDELLDDALRLDELDQSLYGAVTGPIDPMPAAAEYTDEESRIRDYFLPPCQRAATDSKYHVLFSNPSLSYIILDKLYDKQKSREIPRLMKSYNITEKKAEMIFLYMLHGNFAVNQKLGWKRTAEWYEMQDQIRDIIAPK